MQSYLKQDNEGACGDEEVVRLKVEDIERETTKIELSGCQNTIISMRVRR